MYTATVLHMAIHSFRSRWFFSANNDREPVDAAAAAAAAAPPPRGSPDRCIYVCTCPQFHGKFTSQVIYQTGLFFFFFLIYYSPIVNERTRINRSNVRRAEGDPTHQKLPTEKQLAIVLLSPLLEKVYLLKGWWNMTWLIVFLSTGAATCTNYSDLFCPLKMTLCVRLLKDVPKREKTYHIGNRSPKNGKKKTLPPPFHLMPLITCWQSSTPYNLQIITYDSSYQLHTYQLPSLCPQMKTRC